MNIASTANATQAALKALSQAQQGAARAAERIVTGRTVQAADVVDLIAAQTQFEAGAATLKTADQMTGALLDIKA